MTDPKVVEETPAHRRRIRFWVGVLLVVGGLVYAAMLIWGLINEPGRAKLGPIGLVVFLVIGGLIVSGKLRPPGWKARERAREEDAQRAARLTTVPPGMWRCPACHTDNYGTVPRCYRCGSLRP